MQIKNYLKTGKISKVFEGCKKMENAKLTLTTRTDDNKMINSYYNPDGVIPGCEVLCCKNTYRKRGIFNGMIFKVVEVNGGLIKIERNGKVFDDYFVFNKQL